MQLPHGTELGARKGATGQARFTAQPVSETTSRVGQVFRMKNGRLKSVSREDLRTAKEEKFLVCISQQDAKKCTDEMVVVTEGTQAERLRVLVDDVSTRAGKFYVTHDAFGGNTVKFGPVLLSERVNGMGQSSLNEGFVEHADRYYIEVSASMALMHAV